MEQLMLTDAVLLAVLAVCVVTDIRSRRIYNLVIAPGLLAALALQTVLGGWGGLMEALMGFAAGLGILLIPYLLGGIGAGDVKLLALVGAFKGTAFVLTASLYMALAGGVMALLVLLLRKGAKMRLQRVYAALCSLRAGVMPSAGALRTSASEGGAPVYFPYGPAIAGGCLLCYAARGWGIG
ncbi:MULTISPECIES: A24 family peptidase [Paenibacillus]|uniref:A24 family peptidase n=1 Tax=Paenibacillus TaxID=44249 RepID=UPI0022B93825|nr:prepilin peptidase [Paenibacillus caseinilyticus]MCZ8521586.1 prepilin peptidase [Paenibacillus caseinilyticus]